MPNEITALLFERDEKALALVEEKYKPYCLSIAERITGSREDAEEVFNDSLKKLWDAVPPAKPENIKLYLGKIVRNSALNLLEAEKRGGTMLRFDELAECIPAALYEREADMFALREFMNLFIKKLPKQERRVFIKRYWLCESVGEIAAEYLMSYIEGI